MVMVAHLAVSLFTCDAALKCQLGRVSQGTTG